jgi:hypothetical protein
VHRIGRTGRAGARGIATTFFHPAVDGRHAQVRRSDSTRRLLSWGIGPLPTAYHACWEALDECQHDFLSECLPSRGSFACCALPTKTFPSCW